MSKTAEPFPDLDPHSAAQADEPRRIHLVISGHVQGVYYRSAASEHARVLGLRGTVRNLPGGEVELIAEGPPAVLKELIAWCHLGPPAARVDDVSVRIEAAAGEFTDFRILRTPAAH
jgi:acylphosphatase